MSLSSWLTDEQVQELIDLYYKGLSKENKWVQSLKSLVKLIQTRLLIREKIEKLKKEELEEILKKVFTSTVARQSKKRITDNLNSIHNNLIYLFDAQDDQKTKIDSLLKKKGNHRIKGLGMSFWSIFFMAMDPDKNPYWNNKTENALYALGMDYWVDDKNKSHSQQYQRIAEAQQQLVQLHSEADLYSIDLFMNFVTDKNEEGAKLIDKWRTDPELWSIQIKRTGSSLLMA